jgi:long-chain acyl-CoA synthetase
MPRWLLDWFGAIGIPVLEAYGTSENLVPIAANTLTQRRAGTVGKPVGDNEVRIGDDGQVQVRGFGVFDPRLPDNAARASAVGDDGFLSTGDLGAFDDDGFLTLRGRRAEVFKNAQGRWVSLPMIEAALRRIPPVEHAAVVRLARDRLVGVLALTQGTEAGAALKDSEIARERVESALLDRLTHAVNAMPAAMRPIAFIVVCAGFSPASGELTTNLKLRRAAIEARVAAPLAQIASQDVSGDASTRGGISLVFA